MIRVLGVDPGSAATGWALISAAGNRFTLADAGVLRPKGDERPVRLAHLDQLLTRVLEQQAPAQAAVESSFSGRNPRSSLSLAESRGVILAALGRFGLPVTSFSPAEIKLAIVGHGRAQKQQIVFMVTRLLHLQHEPPHDAADAMAVALTFLHTRQWRRQQSLA